MSSKLTNIKMCNTTLGYARYTNIHGKITFICSYGKTTLPCRHCSCQRPEAVTISACTCLIKPRRI